MPFRGGNQARPKTAARKEGFATERLDKYIADRTSLSRKDVKSAIFHGEVAINGTVTKLSDYKVSENDEILLRGNKISKNKHIYIVLNKPQGYVSATEDPSQHTVLELVPRELFRKGLFPAGRLDKDTTGLMIITDDGDFAHRILSPKKHIRKSYSVTLDIPVTPEMKTAFENGVALSDGVCKPAGLAFGGKYDCTVTLFEGRYHQIKRMFGCFGAKVVALRRLSMGGFCLPEKLSEGQCRELSANEIDLIEKDR